jgi:hypothetical protein
MEIMNIMLHARHRVGLSVSSTLVQPGWCVTLSWNVVGVAANVASVHLASGIEDGPTMIEGVPQHGAREVIFPSPGTFTFTLTATFGDGAKRTRQVSVEVQQS